MDTHTIYQNDSSYFSGELQVAHLTEIKKIRPCLKAKQNST